VSVQTVPAGVEASGASGHGRRFGELLVEEGLITAVQLSEALRLQAALRSYLPLGQILLNQGWLTRAQLTAVLKRHRKSARLGELLVRAGRITPDQLRTALARQTQMRRPLGSTLMMLGYLTEEAMREALCAQLHVNFFDLDRIPIDPALARLVNEKYATRRQLVPLFRVVQILVLAMDDPADVTVVEELEQVLRMRVEVVTSTTARIRRALRRLYSTGPRAIPDPAAPSILLGAVRDPHVAGLAARALGARILPPQWQTP
jgi:hypothetical protein